MSTRGVNRLDRKSTRLNSSHTVIYTLSLHDALPIYQHGLHGEVAPRAEEPRNRLAEPSDGLDVDSRGEPPRSEEHTSELQSHRDLHSFPTRRSSDLPARSAWRGSAPCRGTAQSTR